MTPLRTDTPGTRRAWGWVAHLRAGGTTAWADWASEGAAGGRLLPGAQQLELLRRLNAAGPPDPALAERVLAASAPGRGRPDLELLGAVATSRFGPPPVDPARLPDDELIRVATSVLADDLAATDLPAPRRAAFVRPWRTRYRLVGDPWLADPVRADLVARGRPPGGRGSVVLVLATDLPTMLTDAWTARSFAEGGPDWRSWLDVLVARRQVAPRVDVVRAARWWAARIGPARVHIVLDHAEVPALLGVRRVAAAPPPLAADAVDLARRTSSVLGLLVPPERRAALLREVLLPRLATAPGPPLVVPPEHEAWVRRRAVRVREALLRDGYPVHGDPDLLLPREPPTPGTAEVSEAGVLALVTGLLLTGEPGGRADRGRGTT